MANGLTEYIGQLEGELAAKTAEADEFRAKNQELMAENTRLTDLTRMLLESPAFSSFLNQLSGTDGQADKMSATNQQKEPASKVEDTQKEPPKDVNLLQQSFHGQDAPEAQVGMAMMPETYSNLNAVNLAWTENMDSSLYDAQVYAVTSMPEGPALEQPDTGLLSGKSSSHPGSIISCGAKSDGPVIEYSTARYDATQVQPLRAEESSSIDFEFDESDPAYVLYDDTPSSLKDTRARPENIIFGSIEAEKPLGRIILATAPEDLKDDQVSVATREKFFRFCAMMEAPYQRVESITSHLR